jgi:uncharacterized protein (DUF983 family)
MNAFGKFSCPSCGADGQSFRLFQYLERRCSTNCTNCERTLVSEFGSGKYLLLLLYMHIILLLIGLPLVLSLAGGLWLLAALVFLPSLALILPPAMIAHARNVKVREVEAG